MVYRFYRDNSRLARPSAVGGGGMDSVTTIEIQQLMLAWFVVFVWCGSSGDQQEDHGDGHVDREDGGRHTVDSHSTPGGGIIVLVKGRAIVTSPGGQSRAFSQSFILAPQVRGYFVLEDTLRYVGESCAAPGAVAV
ncbi:nuclear transport factor 2-like [Miscanthus floridulus]|uniref:nuclear transport factor 2-like n=1 Tax=Miscanthus floridulus TaxID=154761 RepID=UPI0034583981